MRGVLLVEQGSGEVVEGALTAVVPGAFASGPVVIIASGIDSVALAPRTLEGTIFQSQRVDGGVTVFRVEEVVDVREHRHR